MARIGVPDNIIRLYQLLNWDATAKIYFNGILVSEVKLDLGLRQGAKSSPILFNLLPMDLIDRLNNPAYANWYGALVIAILLFADDMTLVARSLQQLRLLMQIFKDWKD